MPFEIAASDIGLPAFNAANIFFNICTIILK